MTPQTDDAVVIPLREAAEEWASPSAIEVNGRVYAVTVELEKND